MTAEEYETYKEQGYAMNALVGKDGIERAFEEYLHGSSGRKFTTVSASGDVLNEYFAELPQPGSNVELTIDLSEMSFWTNALFVGLGELGVMATLGIGLWFACKPLSKLLR